MDSNTNNESVQNEQIGKDLIVTDTTENASLSGKASLTDDIPEKNVSGKKSRRKTSAVKASSKSNHQLDDNEAMEERLLLQEELQIPEELNEEDGNEEVHNDGIKNDQPGFDYSVFSKTELVDIVEKLIKEKPVETLKSDIENIKIQFYKKHKAEYEKLRKEFLENGGNVEDFQLQDDQSELKLKDILKKYRNLKAEYTHKTEAEKIDNLNSKQAIIEEIKELVNGKESLNETFHQFRELQKRWRSIGPVPQQNLNDLWESYNHHVEKFYDFIKINKELRDLDLKRNLEAKIKLCENAEELLLEPSVIKAFNQLQEYHNKWREVGPAPHEMRADIWNRFKEITSKINKRHQEYFENLKITQQKNLEAKTLLCEKAEEILKTDIKLMKDWEEKSKEFIDLQSVWKTIGFAPKKDNNKIYLRFRSACDNFFRKKREYFSTIKEEHNNNLQLKLDLCVQAEALKDSTEWKKSTEDLINIQKKWKETGPVPRKYSDQIWKRFRAACDTFFNNKSAHFANVDSRFEENMKQKLQLIEQIENYQMVENIEDNFNNLKEFQRKWAEIGFVPFQNKEEIHTRFRKAVDKLFDNIKIDEPKRKLMKFKNRIEQMPQNQRNDTKINREREKFISRLKKLENDIVLWENNIGFFAKTKNAELMIQDVQSKIDSTKAEIKLLEEKIRMIDNLSTE
jgi:hypothetical protein